MRSNPILQILILIFALKVRRRVLDNMVKVFNLQAKNYLTAALKLNFLDSDFRIQTIFMLLFIAAQFLFIIAYFTVRVIAGLK